MKKIQLNKIRPVDKSNDVKRRLRQFDFNDARRKFIEEDNSFRDMLMKSIDELIATL